MPVKSFVILVLLLTVAVLLFMQLAGMPGVIAERRGHPQAKAINLMGWFGLPLGLVPWVIAMIWAQLDPLTITRNIDDVGNEAKDTKDEQTEA